MGSSGDICEEEGRDYEDVHRLQIVESSDCLEQVPLPMIDELFDQLQGAQFFSKIDLCFGYH